MHLDIENLALKINNKTIAWGNYNEMCSFNKNLKNCPDILNIESSDQIQICETSTYEYNVINDFTFHVDVPEVVSDEFNPKLNDTSDINVYLFDGNENSTKFVQKFAKLSLFADFVKKNPEKSYKIAIGKDDVGLIKYNGPFSGNAIDQAIRRFERKYVSVVYEKSEIVSTVSSLSGEHRDNPTYKPAFRSKLIGKASADMDRLIETIEVVSKSETLYAPLISIVQSSGSGKSKLACSVSNTLPCAYVVLREMNDTGYPEKTNLSQLFELCPSASDVPKFPEPLKMDSGIGYICLLIEAIMMDYLEKLKEYIDKKIDKPLPTLMEDCIRGDLFGTQLQSFKEAKTSIKNYETFYSRVKKLSNDISETLIKSNASMKTTPFVLVVDEAFLLGERLNLLRRAAHCMGKNSNFVMLTLGTNSDYLDLNPLISTDSLRGDGRINLQPPFIVARNTDIFSAEIKAAKLKMCPALLRDPRSFLLLVSMGRPLWASMYLERVIQFAVRKIKNRSMESGHSFLACWFIRIGIHANPLLVESARHLIKSVMGTLIHVTEDRRLMSVIYASEPVLAIAAGKLLLELDKDNKKNFISYYEWLLNYTRQHGVDRGRLGEILVGDIALQVMDRTPGLSLTKGAYKSTMPSFTNAKAFILEQHVDMLDELCTEFGVSGQVNLDHVNDSYKIVSVQGFLTTLLGYENYNTKVKGLLSPDLLLGIMNCTHFIPLNDKFPFEDLLNEVERKELGQTTLRSVPGKQKGEGSRASMQALICRELLQIGLKRQAAFLMPDSYYGIDLILPVCLPGKIIFCFCFQFRFIFYCLFRHL